LYKSSCRIAVMSEPEAIQVVTDSRVLAAMSHPLRRRLLDVLAVDGPSTISMLAARTAEASGNVSHHVKVLSRAALVEEAPEYARDRREHWWRRRAASLRWSSTSFGEDEASAAVADAAASLNLEYQVGKVRAWQAESETADPAWLEAAFSTDFWLKLSPDELKQLSAQLLELLERWAAREPVNDGATRTSVFVFARGLPASP
jgi:DNA-binding transcriptional ArsR family regulator